MKINDRGINERKRKTNKFQILKDLLNQCAIYKYTKYIRGKHKG